MSFSDMDCMACYIVTRHWLLHGVHGMLHCHTALVVAWIAWHVRLSHGIGCCMECMACYIVTRHWLLHGLHGMLHYHTALVVAWIAWYVTLSRGIG
ncbi:hypothetical protein CRYO30217_01839 [Parvicella tangerina]|uniref:Uncharacterized protein n=1 Tax=Parvicella tangerina TaxID=2829795 RepID=A0A916NC25_9FLAO|nr:hypothetical protein CRYO30217_01839 [Parvicella tangerina]